MLSTKLRPFPDRWVGEAGSAGDEARGGKGLAPLTYLKLKRASASRPSGDWNDACLQSQRCLRSLLYDKITSIRPLRHADRRAGQPASATAADHAAVGR
jgi:hypothetical protein